MKSSQILLTLIFSLLLFTANNLLSQDVGQKSRTRLEINQEWDFFLERNQGNQLELHADRAKWERVSIPHTLELVPSDVTGLDTTYQTKFHRNVGWYKKILPTKFENNQKIFLEFEGVHQVTNLWVNGKHVGEHSFGGYTPFHFDITDFVFKDGRKNEFLISADNRLNPSVPPDGNQYDYIKFSGLYRDVYLVTTNEVHITFPWEEENAGVFITTPTVTPQNATVDVRTTVRNETNASKECELITRIIDANGLVVSKMKNRRTLLANSDYTFSQIDGISENLRLWSIEKPYLYRVNTTVYMDSIPVDELENKLGIRKFEYVRDKGFLLNGKAIELIGANRHQAYPIIGDAVPNSLHWKDAWQLKQAGFNVVRLAHYPHDNSFIEACDELGILVYEEPPSWIGIGDEAWFKNLEEATRRMVRNHRNHPSILMWGGSLNHRGPVPQLHYACKQEDPTRMTASNGSPWSGPRNSGVTDIYTPMDYQNMDLNPNEFIFLCEHGSSADASRNQFEVSKAKGSANHLGVAVWTAHDYQAFKPNRGLHPRRIFSMYREPNPVYYWYQSELLDRPVVHIADERASNEGQVLVFSNSEEVELRLNGNVIARQFPDQNNDRMYIEHPSFTFELDWKEGQLTATGISRGKIVATHSLGKARNPYRLKVVIEDDNRPFYANASDVKSVKAYVLDKAGNHVTTDSTAVFFSTNGAGEIIGDAALGANPNKAYHGVATAFLKSTAQVGKITVEASADGFIASKATVTTIPYNNMKEIQPYYELKEAKIDLGGDKERLVQFGWTEWNPSLKPKLKDFPELSIGIESDSDLEWQNGWGLSSDLAYVGTDGIKSKNEVTVVFDGLPEGNYAITSYHHLIEEQKNNAVYEIDVNDSLKGAKMLVQTTSGNRLGISEPASKRFKIYSNGNVPVLISIRSENDKIPVILNGLKIKEVKK